MIILIVSSSWLLVKEHEIWVSHYKHICIWEKSWRGKAEEEMQPGQCQFSKARKLTFIFSCLILHTVWSFLIKRWWVGVCFLFVCFWEIPVFWNQMFCGSALTLMDFQRNRGPSPGQLQGTGDLGPNRCPASPVGDRYPQCHSWSLRECLGVRTQLGV